MSEPDFTPQPQAWRLTGYYPEQYAKSMSALGIGIDYDDTDHDRYEAEFLADLAAHDAELLARVRAEIETATTVGWSSFDDGEPLIRTRDALAVLDRLGEQG